MLRLKLISFAPFSGTSNDRWVEGPPSGPYYGSSVTSQKGVVTVNLKAKFTTLKTGDPLPGSTDTLASKQAGLTRVMIGDVLINTEKQGNNTAVLSVTIELNADIIWNSGHMKNGVVPLYIQYAEYEHYSMFASKMGSLANDIHVRFENPQFGRSVDIERSINSIVNQWHRGAQAASSALDAPDGSHQPDGSKIVVPGNYSGF